VCGSIPSGLWIGRMLGVDVRASGSGNIGATNVGRTVGAWPAILTLLLDVTKGALPVLVVGRYGAAPAGLALVGFSAIVGHVLPVFSRFRGGKGVATAFGVFLALAPTAAALALLAFAIVVLATRLVSLASISAAAVLPVSMAILGDFGPRFWVAAAVAVLIGATHRDNLRRLFAGNEIPFSVRRP
jgi:glycerol-3-phosphate acyltransferase PlsY